jgi:two-component system, NarL family, sensor histidine kinase UhpB
MTMRLPTRLSLHTRISLVLTGLAASLLLILGGLWLQDARTTIHEEVEAANKVSLHWLTTRPDSCQFTERTQRR